MSVTAILSGTFDPVHKGHIAFCRAALEQTDVRRVVLLPERRPRGKHGVADFSARVAMLKLAIEQQPGLEILELDDEQFTIEHTLPKLKSQFGPELALLVGSDVTKTFAYRWPGLETLLKEMQLIIALRQTDTEEEVKKLLDGLGYPVRFRCIVSPKLYVASSDVRAGEQRAYLHPHVRQYVVANRLYR